jgi:hypothetical protein
MAIVPVSPGSDVAATRPAPFVPQQVNYTPEAFGAGIGQATQGLGKALGFAGDETAKIATNMAIENDTRAAKAADTQHLKSVMDLGYTSLPGGPEGNKGYYSLQGQDAVTYRPAYEKAVQDSAASIANSMQDSPRAQNFFNNTTQNRVQAEIMRSAVRANEQGLVADNHASAARLGAYKDNLATNYNDPDALANFQRVTRGEVADTGRRMGWSTDQIAEATTKALSGGYRDAILLRAQAGDIAGASQMLKTLAPGMDAETQVSLGQHLAPLMLGAQADALVKGLLGGGKTVGSGLGGTSGPIDGSAKERAQAVHDGMVKRGFDSDTSWAFAANALHESAANPATGPGDGGAAHGLFMWRDSRLTAFQAANGGKLPEQTSLDAQLDFAASELRGPEAGAAGGIAQARGPSGKAAAVSTLYLRPKDTVAEEQRRGATAAQLAGGMQVPTQPSSGPSAPAGNASDANPSVHPDFAGVQQKILDGTAGNDKLRDAALSRLHTAASQYNLSTQADRDKIEKTWKDTLASATAGNDTASIDEASIRHAYRPDIADYMVGQFHEAVQAGQINSSLKLASPEQVRSVLGGLAEAQQGEDPSHFVQRQKALAMAQKVVAQREKALNGPNADPATYAMQDPSVAAAYQSVDPAKPETLQAAIDASFSTQRHLGVQQPSVLSTAAAGQLVRQIESTSANKGDMGAALNQLEKQYGSHYGDVIQDLTDAGLSPRYQMLAHANLDSQATVRSDAQEAFKLYDAITKDKGEWGQGISVEQRKLLEPALDAALANYRQTISAHPDAAGVFIKTVLPSVKTTAQYYLISGRSSNAADAVQMAAGLINKSYNFDDELRVPAAPGMPTTSTVRAAANSMTAGLSDADLVGTTAAEARSGTWFTNGDDKGATLLKGTLQGGFLPVRRADGRPVSIDFKSLPTTAFNARTPGLDQTAMQ